MSKYWPGVNWETDIENDDQPHESSLLKLNCDKVLKLLKWKAVLTFDETVKMSADWYRDYYNDPSCISERTFLQIKEYESLAKKRNLSWAS